MVMMLDGGFQLLKPFQSWPVYLRMVKARAPGPPGKIYYSFHRTPRQYDSSYRAELTRSRPPFINRGIRLCVLLCDTTQSNLG